MGQGDRNGGGNEIAFEAYGVRVAVSSSVPEVLERIRETLPPGWRSGQPAEVETRFSIQATDSGAFLVSRGSEYLGGIHSIDLDLALEMLDTQLRLYVGTNAPDTVFIHAGVVSHHGRAIVIPGPSFAGKTTLVAALTREGAVYCSDEFAVVDMEGHVHPYAKSPSLRDRSWQQTDRATESLSGIAGEESVPIGMIVVTSYRPGAEWSPKRISAGAGAMALLANAVPAPERYAEVMHTISRAAGSAVVIESERDEADAIAPGLLAELEQSVLDSP